MDFTQLRLQSELMTLLTKLFSVFLVLFCFSCTDQKIERVNNSYELLLSSIEKIPYDGISAVIFTDSLGNFCTFRVTEDELTRLTIQKPVQRENPETGVITEYYLTVDHKGYFLINDSLNMQFSVLLKAEPNRGQMEEIEVKDELSIALVTNSVNEKDGKAIDKNKNHSRSLTTLFKQIVNLRSYPKSYIDTPFDKMTILDREFELVYEERHTRFHQQFLKFNYEYGIISFMDHSGNFWRFEEFVEA